MEHNVYGEKIRKVRMLRGYSQQYMAEKLRLSSPKHFSRYETGETKMDLPFMESIAEVLGMSLIELLSFDEKVIFNHCAQHHVMGSHNTYHESGSKEREQLLERIKHLEDEVVFLREQLESASTSAR